MNQSEAEQVFTLMHRHWPEGSTFRSFARNKDKAYGMVCGNPSQLMNAANWADRGGWNSYIQMNPSKRLEGTRVSAADITHWCWFLIDIDPVSSDACTHAALEQVDAVLRNYVGQKTLHRYVIDSGRGLQAWYPIVPMGAGEMFAFRTERSQDLFAEHYDLSLPINSVQQYSVAEAAPRAMSYWLNFLRGRLDLVGNHGCVVDISVSDLPRVMRMPFTINTKTGRRGAILEEAESTNSALGYKLLSYAPYSIWKQNDTTALPGVGASTPWQVFVPHMTRAGRMFLTEGSDEGGRHFAAVAAARSLRDLGCGPEQARRALVEGGKMCSPKLEASEIETIIRRNFNGAAAP